MHNRTSIFIFAILFSIIALPLASTADGPVKEFDMSQIYYFDRGHSYVGFSVKYMGFAKVRGRFTDYSGSLRYDESDIRNTSVTVIIETKSINTELKFRDDDLRSANWFEAEKFPTITFRSKSAVRSDVGVDIIGDLTIKETTKEVTLKMTTSGAKNDIRGDGQVIFVGGLEIDRKDFGVMGERWSAVKEGITAVDSKVEIELTILGKQDNLPNLKNWIRRPEGAHARIYKAVTDNGAEAGIREYESLKTDASNRVNIGVLDTVGKILLKEGKINEAIAVFAQNAESYSHRSEVYNALATAYATNGDRSNAIKNFKLALEKNPASTFAMEVLRHLEK